ncbi:hypothetical protein HYN69_19145 (plasmid) [Gemmobacter aquarius]|uniref:Uncharacterized protein n=1 Tax=Paragemmobacter aquarius TaxID=2169400 RepID=A0A2S0USB5_9RHOB|nr:hypothetical protein HYN69_19145 [Gemmobacter aquarius]
MEVLRNESAWRQQPRRDELRPCDYQAVFEALDSPASPTEALRAAFRRRNEFPAGIHDIEQADD